MDCEGILGGEVSYYSEYVECRVVAPQFANVNSKVDLPYMIGILSQNSWKMNLNETQIGRLSVWTREIITYTIFSHVSSCIYCYSPLKSTSKWFLPRVVQGASTALLTSCSTPPSAISARMRSSRWWLASWAPVLVRASWWIVLRKMNSNMWSLRTRWQSAEMSVYNDGGMVATDGQSRQGMAR